VGGATETEIKEKKSRAEDALSATRAAAEEGVVPGGGVALIRCGQALNSLKLDDPEEQAGAQVIRTALNEPLRKIAENSGLEPGLTVERVREGKHGFGFNAATLQFEDLVLAGVIDPKKVTRIALQNAASIASLLLTTEAVITTVPQKQSRQLATGDFDT
jgi:chaperonin GroEL